MDFLFNNKKTVLSNQKLGTQISSKSKFLTPGLLTPSLLTPSKITLFSLLILLVFLITFPVQAGTEENSLGPSFSHKGSERQFSKLQETEGLAPRFSLTKENSRYGRVYPEPKLENISIGFNNENDISLYKMPELSTQLSGRFAAKAGSDKIVIFSPDTELQTSIQKIVKDTLAPHTSVVVMEPQTGKILAIASKSASIDNLALHAGFPAASLFKIITSTAAIEWSDVNEFSKIFYRGGTYTLNKYNYMPSPKLDKLHMTLGQALGKSCNPVFARLALNHLNSSLLSTYAQNFGFNEKIPFDVSLPVSNASIPTSKYGLSRTAAGFGEVYISPVHAVSLMSAITNQGLMPRPRLVEMVVSNTGRVQYDPSSEYIKRVSRPETANQLINLMHYTTTQGTSQKEFQKNKTTVIPGVEVIGKTGTLRGKNPLGLNTWFIGAAPMKNPKVAIAVITVDPKTRSARASGVARQVLQKFFNQN
ncbi:MAG: penicillin-binding transpeptidase domain-containing protein [Bdellovibrionota bacterium]